MKIFHLRGKLKGAPPKVVNPITYCPHQFHCRECEDRFAKQAQSWMALVDKLEREVAELKPLANLWMEYTGGTLAPSHNRPS